MRFFLSYNEQDLEITETIGRYLQVCGEVVWFDRWKIFPGDSISAGIEEGLKDFDVFLLIHSTHSQKSSWVIAERGAALKRWRDGHGKIVPIIIDDTPIPPLLSDVRYIDFRGNQDVKHVVTQLLNLKSEDELRLRVSNTLEELGLLPVQFHTEALICCGGCGASPEHLNSTEEYTSHGHYLNIKCAKCGWCSGGEI